VHRANVRRNNDELRRLNRERLGEYLSRQHCVDCGLDDIRVLEFDHRPGEFKTGIIGKMLVDSVSWRRILQEIAKCDVRCANCHRIVTAERAGNWRQRHREAG
jgi:hypothetical protein